MMVPVTSMGNERPLAKTSVASGPSPIAISATEEKVMTRQRIRIELIILNEVGAVPPSPAE
jgi:hypothetical protein